MLDGTEERVVFCPCLIVAHPDRVYQTQLARAFRRLGWDTYAARSGPEARRLMRLLDADAVILHTDLAEESGWLTCDKLTREQPLARVILISDDLSPRHQELALFVGASALIHQTDDFAPLIEELVGPPVTAVG
jgi:DNA-binding response OmpR family regulator